MNFEQFLESSNEEFILQALAHEDINADVKNGQVTVHKSNIDKAKKIIKKNGLHFKVVGGLNE